MTSVSVIIPTYNRAALVDRCLRSLVACRIPDLEILVVDDGGADETAEVVSRHGATYLRQANAGPATARNTGFAASRGEFVSFIDSDDEWIHGGATRLRDELAANPEVSLIFGDSSMGNDAEGFVSFVETYGGPTFAALPHTTGALGIRVLHRQPFFLALSTRNVMFLGSLLVRRSFFSALGGFEPALRGAADWDFFMRATAQGSVAYSAGPPVSRYYKHEAGMSTDSDHMEEDFIRALESVRRRSALDEVERQHVRARIRDHIFGWAWRAYDRGDLRTARKRIRMAREAGEFHAREATLLAATYLPQTALQALRRARRAVASGRR
jgi:glycosyltransferase involved in cell wall biosynthesis